MPRASRWHIPRSDLTADALPRRVAATLRSTPSTSPADMQSGYNLDALRRSPTLLAVDLLLKVVPYGGLRGLFIPLLVLPLLGGCVDADHLVTSRPADPSAVEETVSLLESERSYTSHRTTAAK